MKTDYLIIGAGIAGTTAAETIRANDPNGSIVLVGDEPYPLYSRVMLSLVAKGKLLPEKIILKNDEWYASNHINFLRGGRVLSLDTTTQTAILLDSTKIVYGKALIATGGRPRQLGIPGERLAGVYRLQTIANAIALLTSVSAGQNQPAVVIGGGMMAIDFINVFFTLGAAVTVCLRGPLFMERALNAVSSQILEKHLENQGVRVIKGVTPLAFVGGDRVEVVNLSDGSRLSALGVGVSSGLEPNIDFLRNIGVSPSGVVVNEYLESMVSGVFAAGDAADFNDLAVGCRHALGNWQNAREQGKTAGANMSGARASFWLVSTQSANLLGLDVSLVGDTDKEKAEVIMRSGENFSALFYVRDNILRGAAFINCPSLRAPALAIIKSGKNINVDKSKLADQSFDLKNFLI